MTPSPLRSGDDRTRDTVRDLFGSNAFSEAALRLRGDLAKLPFAGDAEFYHLVEGISAGDAQTILIRLFLSGHSVPANVFASTFSTRQREALSDTDLIRTTTVNDEPCVYSPVTLSPIRNRDCGSGDLLIVGDRQLQADGSRARLPADVVFTGHNPLTTQFLSLLPDRQLSTALDLCCGGGVATLMLGARGSHVVGADISPRSLHFARFNAWLNGVECVRFVEGDLYEPVGSDTFPFICAHPPYVPTLRPTAVFRDGGTLGDEIVRRIVAGIGQHLADRGEFYLLCMGMDITGAPFEERLRAWLGSCAASFDLIFAVDHFMTAPEFADYIARRTGESAPQERSTWLELLAQHHVEKVLYGAVIGRRCSADTPGESRRVQLDAAATANDFDRLLQWLERTRTADFGDWMLHARMTLAPGGRLEVEHSVVAGAYEPTSVRVGNNGRPFPALVNTEPWIASLLSTLHEHESLRTGVRAAQQAGRLPPQFSDADAVRVAAYMAERGILEIAG